jgi:O-antigen ligase
VATGLTALIVLATVSFGAVYPWAYWPLFAAAACIGFAAFVRPGKLSPESRALLIGILCVAAAIAIEVIPLSRPLLDKVSPHAGSLLTQISLSFAADGGSHTATVNARATLVALAALVALGVYMAGLPALLTRHDLRAFPRNLTVFAVLMAVLGIYGRERNNGLVYGFWQPLEGTNANGFGPFVNRNHFAGWMLLAICLAIGSLCGRVENGLKSIRPGFRNRVLWLSTPDASSIVLMATAVLAMTVSLVWTMSRSGIISFGCAVVCFAWLVARRRQVSRAARATGVVTLAAVVAVGVSTRGIDRIVAWFGDTSDVFSRLAAWRDGWQVVRDFPFVGTGMNTYADAMRLYQKNVQGVAMTRAHNDYLQLLAEGGLLVLVPAIVAAGLLASGIWRRLRQVHDDSYEYWVRIGAAIGLFAISVQELSEFSLHIPANALLFSTVAAIAIAPWVRTVHGPSQAVKRAEGS